MFVKICCISSLKEAQMATDAGASAIGLVGKMPSGPGVIDDDLIAEIASDVEGVETFLLTSETDPNRILDHHHESKDIDNTTWSTVLILGHIHFFVKRFLT